MYNNWVHVQIMWSNLLIYIRGLFSMSLSGTRDIELTLFITVARGGDGEECEYH